MICSLTLFSVCLPLGGGFRNRRARILCLILMLSSLLSISGFALTIMGTLLMGTAPSFPSLSSVMEGLSSLALVIGLAAVSANQRRERRVVEWLGYLILILVFLFLLFLIYTSNLEGTPPVVYALVAGTGMTLSFFSAVFAWSFYFSADPPLNLTGKVSRFLLVAAMVLQLFARSAFALNYAFLHQQVPLFYYAGSAADALLFFSGLILLTAVLALLAHTVESFPAHRPASIRLSTMTVIVSSSLILALILTVDLASLALASQVMGSLLPAQDTSLALQTFGGGLMLIVVLTLLVGGGAAAAMGNLLMKPLEGLNRQVLAVTEPGMTAYREPPALIFTELQSLSDSFGRLVDRINRIIAELRSVRPEGWMERGASRPVDFYIDLLSHEIRNYSQVILSNMELMGRLAGQGEGAKDQMAHCMTAVTEAVDKIRDILGQVQTLRRLEREGTPDLVDTDLIQGLSKAVQMVKSLYPQRRVRVEMDLPSEPCYVLANALLEDLFVNLLRNAVDNDPHEEVVIEVAVRPLHEQGVDYWQTTITDRGLGIPDEEKDTLFLRDQRGARRRGLGLLLVATLVEAYRGKIRVENRVPGDHRYGTVFTVLLPRAEHVS